MGLPVIVAESVDDMIRHNPVVIVEAASQQAVRDYSGKILSAGIDLVVMSVGALLDLDLDMGRVHVPSGAIGGLDAVRSAALAGIDGVVLTSRKNPRALDRSEREEKVIFDGFAEEAVKLFPKEMNVAATLSLAARPARVRVKVVSDPKVNRNVHEIHVAWKHGEMLFRFSNDPHPDNPKTSALAAWSAISLLKDILTKYP
jgi:aspartate dehydrogenase